MHFPIRFLLTPFLNKRSNEILGVRLKHIVDLVENRVDVLGQFLVPFGDVGLDGDFVDFLVLLAWARLPAVLRSHGAPPSVGSEPTLTRRCDTFALSEGRSSVGVMSVPSTISLITLGARDVPALTAFYQGIGFELSTASVEGDVSFFKTGGSILALWGVDDLRADADAEGAPGGFRGCAMAINVASEAAVDDALASAIAAGATIARPATKTDWGGYNGYFADPEGNLWEIAYNPHWPLDASGMPQLP